MFKKARIKLTLLYILIVCFFLISFSIVIYSNVVRTAERAIGNYERRVEQRFGRMQPLPPPGINSKLEAIEDFRNRTLTFLILINLTVVSIAGGLSYIFAGLTLNPIEAMMEKQKKFIADAAHEIKTPLTSIKTQLEVGINTKKFTTPEGIKTITSVIEDVDELNKLTHTLLSAGKYQDHRYRKVVEEFNVVDLLEKVVKSFKGKIEEKKLTLVRKYKDKNLVIVADSIAIKELLIILLDNAVKFNKQDGSIELSIASVNDKLILEFKDTGIGIKEKDQKNIFGRFYKADNSRTKNKYDGYGLGLAIAQDIVQTHNGTISVKSILNVGTTFSVILPLG